MHTPELLCMGCHQRVSFKVVLFTMECPGCGYRRDLSPILEGYVFGSQPSVQSPDPIVFGPDYEDFVIDNQSPDYHG